MTLNLFAQDNVQSKFNALNTPSNWELKFHDSGERQWQRNWFLDGLKANVLNTNKGMLFSAGAKAGDDSNHAVLWTKQSFKGDVKIEFEYTRMDTMKSQVNILYIQATGVYPHDPDIFKWKDERTIPYMKTYFNQMKCLHISYAAFDEGVDYIRARMYPLIKGGNFNHDTMLPPTYFNLGLFETGKTYKITIIKTKTILLFQVKNSKRCCVFSWDLPVNIPTKGRIGIRHMYTRSALYKNFKIYESSDLGSKQ